MKPRMSGMADVARGSLKHGSRSRVRRLVDPRHLLGGEVEVVDAELAGPAEDAVVDVGDVAHALRVVAEIAQAALQHVVGETTAP